jgi:hypothetical protein
MKKLFAVLVLFSCSGSDDVSESTRNLVPSNLYSRHVSEFYTEASDRGLTPTVIAPVVVFADVPNCSDQGYGYSKSRKDGSEYIIEIDNSLSVYENDLNFGTIIFRELAHLVLSKPYDPQHGTVCDYPLMYPCYDLSFL